MPAPNRSLIKIPALTKSIGKRLGSLAGLLLAWALACPAAAIPPPPGQVSANCESPTYASDQLVCNDPELAALDQLLASLVALGMSQTESGAADQSDEDWFQSSRLCAFEADHRACLLKAYCKRISLLNCGTPAACLNLTPENQGQN